MRLWWEVWRLVWQLACVCGNVGVCVLKRDDSEGSFLSEGHGDGCVVEGQQWARVVFPGNWREKHPGKHRKHRILSSLFSFTLPATTRLVWTAVWHTRRTIAGHSPCFCFIVCHLKKTTWGTWRREGGGKGGGGVLTRPLSLSCVFVSGARRGVEKILLSSSSIFAPFISSSSIPVCQLPTRRPLASLLPPRRTSTLQPASPSSRESS